MQDVAVVEHEHDAGLPARLPEHAPDLVRAGLPGTPGRLVAELAHVVRLIRRHRPDEADALIRVTEAPVREALKQLPARELKRLGVEIAEASDAVEVRATDTAVDKWVDAMLAGLRDELEQAEAGP